MDDVQDVADVNQSLVGFHVFLSGIPISIQLGASVQIELPGDSVDGLLQEIQSENTDVFVDHFLHIGFGVDRNAFQCQEIADN